MILMKKKEKKLRSHNSARVISLGFIVLVLAGALLLMLPIASRDRTVTPFKDTLFTAISASCVTGLVIHDTATHWSLFGQSVILALIQIGGMGVITIGLLITRLSGRKIGLRFRGMMQDSISAPQIGGILQLTKFIVKITALIELAGAALLYPVFCRKFGALKGIYVLSTSIISIMVAASPHMLISIFLYCIPLYDPWGRGFWSIFFFGSTNPVP